MTTKRKYGWVRDLPDQRDLPYMISAPVTLPPVIDLRSQMPKVYNQGQLGSCTANAIAAAYEFEHVKQGFPDFMPSRLFIYYNERDIEGDVGSDSGAAIRDGIKSINKQGVCSEDSWPYNISKFTKKPSCECYKEALKDQALQYSAINQVLYDLKTCLALGYPFVFGFSVYESFESAEVGRTGIVPMPEHSESLLGGHAVLAVGYDDPSQRFIVRNSWGEAWGQSGYFTIPYTYLTDQNLSDDYWTIKMVE